MILPVWIASRYLHTHRQAGFITLLTGISIAGVALGVTALLTVLAVMNGFEREIQNRITGTDAHVILLGETASGVKHADSLAARARLVPGVVGVAPFTYTKAMVIHGEALAKPGDAADAGRMLRLLSGRTHDVLTGVCLCARGRKLVCVESSRVRMAELTDEEIAWYVSTGEPADKAGAYAVQGLASRFIAGIDGSYSNVVGLPISRVYELLKALGCAILGAKETQ